MAILKVNEAPIWSRPNTRWSTEKATRHLRAFNNDEAKTGFEDGTATKDPQGF